VLAKIARRLESVTLVVTESGREGRALVSSLTPTVIVLDTELTDCAAYDLVVFLVHPARPVTAPLAVLSGNANEQMRFLQGGAAACLTKPLKIADVEQTMNLLLDRAATR
jgi:DNA-binding response OmpR family regulator